MKEKLETTELLILSDGKIFVHNLTPAMAKLLAELDPDNLDMRQRAKPKKDGASFEIPLKS